MLSGKGEETTEALPGGQVDARTEAMVEKLTREMPVARRRRSAAEEEA